ncbi:MAG: DNA-processing protein DprA, partial [Gaiellaceae bacterium]
MLDREASPREPQPIVRGESRYPPQLLELHDPPPQLYVRGQGLDLLGRPMVALVGARACSGYAQSVASNVGRAVAEAGFVVVSGLARGVDSAAHRGALESTGATIAVLGCGVDVTYPKRNVELAKCVGRRGLLISEDPDGTPAAPF